MGIYDKIYYAYVKGTGHGGVLFNKIVAFLKKRNPVISYKINGVSVCMPFSQSIPLYMERFRNYDRQLGRICKFLSGTRGFNRAIYVADVGANVGDTVVNIGLKLARYLCVEGTPQYAALLKKNLKGKFHYKLEECYCGEKNGG